MERQSSELEEQRLACGSFEESLKGRVIQLLGEYCQNGVSLGLYLFPVKANGPIEFCVLPFEIGLNLIY